MEDFFSVAYQQSEDEKDLEYAFFGIYDGHGGQEAAVYAKEHLMNSIVRNPKFWSEDDDEVLKSIHEGYLATHHDMWRNQGEFGGQQKDENPVRTCSSVCVATFFSVTLFRCSPLSTQRL
jgi:serine/threonine protein phosphatase PrpC